MSAPMMLSRMNCLPARSYCQPKKSLERMSAIQRFMMSDDRENLEYLERTKTSKIAYRQTPGKDPGVLFLPGFMSNMTGRKAVALEGYCRRSGHAFVRYVFRLGGPELAALLCWLAASIIRGCITDQAPISDHT